MKLTPFFLGVTYIIPLSSAADWCTGQLLALCKCLNPETEYWTLLTNSQHSWCNMQFLEPAGHWGAARFTNLTVILKKLPVTFECSHYIVCGQKYLSLVLL